MFQAMVPLGLYKDVDVPRICVAGKQSSGKSSVMEALTGIAVPRTAGQSLFQNKKQHFDSLRVVIQN